MSRNENEIEIEDLYFHYETPEYYCVSVDEDTFTTAAERTFLSKVYTSKDGDNFVMPEWYAESKGLV